tara:strand:- start:92 stop:394 length:303 start_codon:yes stop_codon:yes gene_type:complete
MDKRYQIGPWNSFRETLCDEVGADPDVALFLPEGYFDACLAGYDTENACFVYYSDKVIECFVEHQDMDLEEAMEWFSYNVAGSKGDGFPTYIESLNITNE